MIYLVPPSKRERISLLAKGLLSVSGGFIFIIVGGTFRTYAPIEPIVLITQCILSWVFFLLGAIYLSKGMPTREAYFFDELNQILVYELDLLIDTSLDSIFELLEKNAINTRNNMRNELKQRDSVLEYIQEIAFDLKIKPDLNN